MPKNENFPIPYYKNELVTLYCGDCITILPEIQSVDLVVTSPPYNLRGDTCNVGAWRKWQKNGIEYDAHNDDMPLAEYEAWQRKCLSACWDTLTDSGAIFYNHKQVPRDGVMWLPTVCNPDLPLRQIITWDRRRGVAVARMRFTPMTEWVMVFAKPNWKLTSKKMSGMSDIWRFSADIGREHPAPFPVQLPANAIASCDPGLVLDPFCGSGTTLVAASMAGIPSIGIEISETYCDIAASWLDSLGVEETLG